MGLLAVVQDTAACPFGGEAVWLTQTKTQQQGRKTISSVLSEKSLRWYLRRRVRGNVRSDTLKTTSDPRSNRKRFHRRHAVNRKIRMPSHLIYRRCLVTWFPKADSVYRSRASLLNSLLSAERLDHAFLKRSRLFSTLHGGLK